MSTTVFLLAMVFGFMLAEQRISLRHERVLRARGAVAPPGDVFPALAVLYPAAFLAMGIEGIWRQRGLAVPPSPGEPSWTAAGVLLFAASKALKFWAIGALRERWSFRVYVEPGRPLVTSGPYRFVTHPNYIAVAGELVGTAMMMGAPITGPVMTLVVGVMLLARIRFEERVLSANAPRQ
jgi:methyltransferase